MKNYEKRGKTMKNLADTNPRIRKMRRATARRNRRTRRPLFLVLIIMWFERLLKTCMFYYVGKLICIYNQIDPVVWAIFFWFLIFALIINPK